jgi:hypothetical protein
VNSREFPTPGVDEFVKKLSIVTQGGSISRGSQESPIASLGYSAGTHKAAHQSFVVDVSAYRLYDYCYSHPVNGRMARLPFPHFAGV